MCFKKPKAPEKTEEEKRAEEELAALRKQRQEQLNQEITEEKESDVEAEIARQAGLRGNRSLISGSKGGSGFLGKNARKKVVNNPRRSTAPPPIAGIPFGGIFGGNFASLINLTGGTGGGGGGGRTTETMEVF